MSKTELIEAWREILGSSASSWVLFENGTCVILAEPEDDLAAQATSLLKEWGPVHAGSSFGDFSVLSLKEERGWLVTSHRDEILTFVDPDEVSADAEDVVLGLLGRSKRGQDAEELRVLHMEDSQSS